MRSLVAALVVGSAVAYAGCVQVPTAAEYRGGTVVAATARYGSALRDDRPRFREIFCGALDRARGIRSAGDCEEWLWRLADEPASAPRAAPLPARPDFRAFVITGAFSDCFDEYALAYWSAARVLDARGYRVEVLPVSGRSSVEHNALRIAEALGERGVHPSDRVVLIGYSKGALDALEFIAAHPDAAAPVVAVVSISGPMLGSPAAAAGKDVYALFADAFGARCDPGDGGVLDSLTPAARLDWFATHSLPPRIAYFSLGSFTTRERLARGVWPSWRFLAMHDPWNDGQVAAASAIIPGGAILGYANADHWGVALNIEVSEPLLGRRKDSTPFPREPLLEAILLHVGERLAATPAASAPVTATSTSTAAATAPAPAPAHTDIRYHAGIARP